MSTPKFDKQYYQSVIATYGYDVSVFEGFSQDLPSIDKDDLQSMFLCHEGLYDFRDNPKPKAVLTGFGLSGVPHLGTLSQMNRIGILNQAGYRAEVILGDLDAYNGKRTPFSVVRSLATLYERFIRDSNLLDEDTSRVRSQFDHPEVTRTSYMLARYASDELFAGREEDLHDLYVQEGKVDVGMTYPRKQSLNLMIADFIHLGQTFPHILVMLGIDEHQYVRTAQELARQIDPEDAAFSPVTISCLYTPIISGLRGFPKMSKSFPESGINLGMSYDEIKTAISDEPDTFDAVEQSVIYQIACGIGLTDSPSLLEARRAAIERGNQWAEVKDAVIGRIAYFASLWQEVSRHD